MSEIRILALGDAVGSSGVGYLADNRCLAKAIRSLGAHFTVVNAENSADGNGILPQSAEELFDAGADILTGGNHTFRRREIYHMLDDCENLLRPANLPAAAQGHGWTVYDAAGIRILVMNLLGTVFMEPLASPFETADAILEKCRGGYDIGAWSFPRGGRPQGKARARAVSDGARQRGVGHSHPRRHGGCRILGGHTGFITDLGMVGSADGILGVKSEAVLHKFLVKTPVRFETEHGNEGASGALFTVDCESGKCISAESVSF